MTFSSDPATLASCDIVYLSRDVPTNQHNISELAPVRALLDTILTHLRPGAILVILCQVSPGFTREFARTMQPQQCDRQLFYQVETLIFGAALERALKPERYIVGTADPAKPLPDSYQTLLGAFGCPILPMRYESAELAKISINMYLVAQVVTTNTIAEVCEQCGAEWSEIAPALRLDRRIGAHAYLAPGLGIAGGNLERDLVTIKTLSQTFGTESGLIDAWWRNLEYRRDWAIRTLYHTVLSKVRAPRIAVWGLAYKQDTDSIKNSPALALLSSLGGYDVAIYDPKARLERWEGSSHCPKLRQVASAEEAIAGADVLVIMTPWSEFKEWDGVKIRDRMRGCIVIDPHRVLAPTELLSIYRLGTPSPESLT